MNSRRTVIIAAALVLAVFAFIGNVYYLHSAQSRAYGNAKLVKVFVVSEPIPKGLEGKQAISQEFVKAGQIPQQYRPGSAVTDINDIEGKVAITALSPGQVIVDGQFVDANVAQVTFSQRVPAGQVAFTVSVDQVHGVAGLLLPGDKVDAIVTGVKDGKTVSQVMYQNMNILAIGSKAAPTAGDSAVNGATAKNNQQTVADSGLITFSLPLEAAQRLALVTGGSGSMSLYLVLVPPDSQPVAPAPATIPQDDVLDNLPVTPYDK